MLKKIVALCLSIAAILSLAACNPRSGAPLGNVALSESSEQTQTTVPTSEPYEFVVDDAFADVPETTVSGEMVTDPTEESQSDASAPVGTEPSPTDPTGATAPTGDDFKELTFEEYLAMSPEEQLSYCYSFPSVEAYALWYTKALQEYDQKEVIEATGPIDLSGLGGN